MNDLHLAASDLAPGLRRCVLILASPSVWVLGQCRLAVAVMAGAGVVAVILVGWWRR